MGGIILPRRLKIMSETVCTFSLDDKTKIKIQEIAEQEHRSLAGQIRLILEEYLEKQK